MSEYKHLGVNYSKIKKTKYNNKGEMIEYSTVKKLAYNNAAKYEKNGVNFDYTKKQVDDHLENFFILPDGVKTNEKKEKLFAIMEDKYNKIESFIAANYIINLPRELSYEDNKKIIMNFFEEMSNKKRLMIDVSFHLKNEGKENENLHCHILEGRRVINNDGSFGNAFRTDKNTMYLDSFKFVKKELAKRFSEELKKQNKNVIYTDLSNIELKNQALENGDYETALAKDYDTKYNKKTKNNTHAFNSSKNYADQKKKQWAAQQREEKRRLKEEAKQKAEVYSKTKKEIELLEIEQKFIEEDLENVKLFKSDFLEQEITKQELKNYYLKNKEKLVELYKNKQKYEEEKREKERINRDLIISFFNDKPTREDLKTNAQIKNYFKERLINKGYKYDDELKFFVNSLSYNLMRKEDYYLNKVPYFVYKNNNEDEELKYKEILDKERINEEERIFKEKYERKKEFKDSFIKEVFNYVNKELKLSKEEYNKYIEMIVKQQFDLKNQQQNNIFNSFESKFIIDSKTKFFTNAEIVNEMFNNKEAFLKRLESNKEIKNQRDKAIERIENSKEIAKAAQNLAKEVLEEEDENIKELYDSMNDILNNIYRNNKNNVYNTYKFTY
ncbi:TPA: MobA/MobL family protein [Haemophilus influenzae]